MHFSYIFTKFHVLFMLSTKTTETWWKCIESAWKCLKVLESAWKCMFSTKYALFIHFHQVSCTFYVVHKKSLKLGKSAWKWLKVYVQQFICTFHTFSPSFMYFVCFPQKNTETGWKCMESAWKCLKVLESECSAVYMLFSYILTKFHVLLYDVHEKSLKLCENA